MKFFLLALFVVAATAAPTPLEDDGGPVEVIVNGVPEGEPLEIGDLIGIKVKEHVNGQLISATNILHPFTAVGLAEAAAAAAAETDEGPIFPEPVVLPPPVAPEVVIPEPIILLPPIAPEVVIPEPVVLPPPVAPEVIIPEPVVLPPPVAPEVVFPESIPSGELFNDGVVQVTLNAPQDAGVLSTLQSWFSMALNYFSDGVQTSHQIV